MKDLSEVRREIDAIDSEMVNLFVRRMKAADAVAEAKRSSGTPVLNPAREREILAKVAGTVGADLENEARILFTTLMSISRSRQRAELSKGNAFAEYLARTIAETPARFPSAASVACAGIEGAYTQQAACRLVEFPTIFYFKGFDDVFAAVEKGMCDYGVLPIENSAVGSVTAVYDLMAKHDFKIVKAMKLRIRHVLLAPKGVKLADVKEVSSHPYALAQCGGFLRAHPAIRPLPAANTAVAAAELAKSGRRDAAVIAARECAELYGLDILEEEISDVTSNYTRFICISRKGEIYREAGKVSLLMNLGHRPGALSDVLVKFAAVGVNLTKLESRPILGTDFEFRFIFEVEASPHDERVVNLLAGLANDPDIEHFTFLGAYGES